MTFDRSGLLLRAATAAGAVTVIGVEIASAASVVSVPAGILIGFAATAVFARTIWPLRTERFGAGLAPADLVIVAFALVTLGVALVAAPNTWDSMTYHLPRIDHWLDQGTVNHYATAIDRQLWQPPFSEYLMLVARALGGGGDRFAAVVQWLAFLGCALAAARIAALLGLPARGARLAAVVAMTIPAVVVQATSTQNDLLAAFWILVLAGLVLEADLDANPGRLGPWIGVSLALAIGTKGTAIVFGLPWVAIFAFVALRRSPREGIGPVLLVLLTVAVMNGPWAFRNLETYGNLLGDPVVQPLLRPASLDPGAIVANLVANSSVHWATPLPGADRVAAGLAALVFRGLGQDPAILFPYFGGYRVVPWSTDEDQTGNPLLFLTGVAVAVVSVLRWQRLPRPNRIVLVGTLVGLVLFGVAVRWQPFNSRLQLPGFLPVAPLVVVCLWNWRPLAARGLAAASVLAALVPLIANASRPFLGGQRQIGTRSVSVASVMTAPRTTQYFVRNQPLEAGYVAVIDRLIGVGCFEVALATGYDSWEYPLWMLARSSGAAIRFRPNWVVNATRKHQPPAPMPCAVVALDQPATWVPEPFTGWTVAVRSAGIALWLPGGAPTRTP